MKKKLIVATLMAGAAYWGYGFPGLIVVAASVALLAALDALGVERVPNEGDVGFIEHRTDPLRFDQSVHNIDSDPFNTWREKGLARSGTEINYHDLD